MSAKTHANIAVRLPERLISALDSEKEARNVRSLTRVIDMKLAEQIAKPNLFQLRHQPKVNRRVFSIKAETAARLRDLANEHETDIGSLVFSLLDSEPGRFISTRSNDHAQSYTQLVA